ncbi:HNH endonuclease OS=Streptomyces microflavus OX=1919 GN=Smic_80730 PE=4 SV=1 [Streptomyces microflavus]
MLLTFRGPAPSSTCVARHLDDDGQNNALVNLRWGSRSENEGDKVQHGTSNRGAGDGRAKLSDDDVREIRRRIGAGATQVAVAHAPGIPAVTVNHIHTGRTWGHVA